MTPKEMLSYAIAFHLGHYVFIKFHGKTGWSVDYSDMCWCEMRGRWETEFSPSSRTEKFIARTRYTLKQAFTIGLRLVEEAEKEMREQNAREDAFVTKRAASKDRLTKIRRTRTKRPA